VVDNTRPEPPYQVALNQPTSVEVLDASLPGHRCAARRLAACAAVGPRNSRINHSQTLQRWRSITVPPYSAAVPNGRMADSPTSPQTVHDICRLAAHRDPELDPSVSGQATRSSPLESPARRGSVSFAHWPLISSVLPARGPGWPLALGAGRWQALTRPSHISDTTHTHPQNPRPSPTPA
jgi:hypothetical protein